MLGDEAYALSKKYTNGVALNGVPVQPPRIDPATRNWLVYNPVSDSWTDTGVTARGVSPKVSAAGTWEIWSDAAGDYVDTGILAGGPPDTRAYAWYADAVNGNDNNDGRDGARPMRTITAVLAAMRNLRFVDDPSGVYLGNRNITVNLAAGVYDGGLDISGATMPRMITFSGPFGSAPAVTINHSITVQIGAVVTFQRLALTGGINVYNGSYLRLSGCRVGWMSAYESAVNSYQTIYAGDVNGYRGAVIESMGDKYAYMCSETGCYIRARNTEIGELEMYDATTAHLWGCAIPILSLYDGSRAFTDNCVLGAVNVIPRRGTVNPPGRFRGEIISSDAMAVGFSDGAALGVVGGGLAEIFTPGDVAKIRALIDGAPALTPVKISAKMEYDGAVLDGYPITVTAAGRAVTEGVLDAEGEIILELAPAAEYTAAVHRRDPVDRVYKAEARFITGMPGIPMEVMISAAENLASPRYWEEIKAVIAGNAGRETVVTGAAIPMDLPEDVFLYSNATCTLLAGDGKLYTVDNYNDFMEFDPQNKELNIYRSLNSYTGGVLANNGKLYFLPERNGLIAAFDTENKTITVFGNISDDPAGFYNRYGLTLANNGKIYGMPTGVRTVLEFDPETNVFSFFGDVAGGFNFGSLTENGKIIATPRSMGVTDILEIDPETATVSIFGSTFTVTRVAGTLAADGKIYCIENLYVYEIDPVAKTVARHNGIAIYGEPHTARALAPNGRIYAGPPDVWYSNNGLIEFDPATKTCRAIGGLGNATGEAGRIAPDGKLYCFWNEERLITEVSFGDELDNFTPGSLMSAWVNRK